MNRDVNSRSALLALARSRRTQRALAHAFLHRHAPIPTLRTSLGYMTSTARFVDERNPGEVISEDIADATSTGHHMVVLGIHPGEGVAYVVEELGGDEAPIVYRLFLRGAREGHLVPLHTWYEQAAGVDAIRTRLDDLQPRLVAATRTAHEAWMLSTRVIQRRALRATNDLADVPIRKYALQLVLEPVSGHGPSGKTTVTAFLRPEATLVEAWALPDNRAIARVTYTGIPSGMGQDKDTVVLLTGL